MRTLTALAALVLSVSTLSACGSEANSAYCKDLKSDKAYFDSFSGSSPDLSKIDQAFSRLHSLAKEAPSEVSDDWKTIDGAIQQITSALKDAGLKLSDLSKLQSGQVPAGVDVQKLQALAPKLQSLSGAKFDKASKAIEKHAKDTCKVNLGSS